MNKQEVLTLINACTVCCLATADGDIPRGRYIMPYKSDENGIIFHTGKGKDMHKQIQKNPKVELCFFNPKDNVQVRVNGTAELVEDLNLKKEIVAKRDFLKPIIEKIGYEPFAVYRVKNGSATVWTFQTNLAPKEYVSL